MKRRLKRYLTRIYQGFVRPFLPVEGPALYAGVPVSVDRKHGDTMFERYFGPFNTKDIADYEYALVVGLRDQVRPGDTVVVVGGGFGATVVIAALLAGPDGQVTCFEGGAAQFDLTCETVRRNGVAGRVTVHHAVVGPADHVYGTSAEAHRVAPEDLPVCDVLELDCEGAEVAILNGIKFRPRAILVETHGLYDAPTGATRDLLVSLGYDVTDLGLAEPRGAAFCEENDVRVLCGRLAA